MPEIQQQTICKVSIFAKYRYIIMMSFSVTSIFHVIIVEKQLIKHDISTHCLTCNFRHNYVPIQLIPVGVERSNGTPTGTSRLT